MKAKQVMVTTIVSVVWTLVLAVPVMAQRKPWQSGEEVSVGDRVRQCQTHYQETAASIDQLTARMEAAERSNDPAQMRATLDGARQPLEEIKDRLVMCMQGITLMQEGTGDRVQGAMSGRQGQPGSSGASTVGSSAMARMGQVGWCCPPPREIPAIVGITGVVLVVAFVVSLIAALTALTIFLLRRSRTRPTATA